MPLYNASEKGGGGLFHRAFPRYVFAAAAVVAVGEGAGDQVLIKMKREFTNLQILMKPNCFFRVCLQILTCFFHIHL